MAMSNTSNFPNSTRAQSCVGKPPETHTLVVYCSANQAPPQHTNAVLWLIARTSGVGTSKGSSALEAEQGQSKTKRANTKSPLLKKSAVPVATYAV
jgi:hypothetical protein